MSSVKAVLRKKINSKGLYPIAIRIIKDRKTSFLYIGQYIRLADWDDKNNIVKKAHPDALHINQLILKQLSDTNRNIIESQVDDGYISVSGIKNKILNKTNNDFFVVSEYYLKRIKDRKQFHQLDIEKQRLKVFKDFTKRDSLNLIELDLKLIKEFDSFLLNKRKLSERTVVNYMIMIRTILNLAVSDFSMENKSYPFGKGKYQIKFPETKKVGLNVKEVQLLENLADLTNAQQYALNVWLISFYFAGIRVSDVLMLKWQDFVDGRLEYRMGKNNKLVSLKIPEKALAILNILERDKDSIYLFKELEGVDISDKRYLRMRIKTATRNFNRRLEIIAEKAGIEKKLSMHIARHSFGNISGDSISIQMLQKLYRHSSITTTILYQSNFIQKDADDALDKVIDF
ncbi:site-specific integrase [Bizionia arctica]|uniref:Transposase n=1 Tax=Bizionia arctica TaxID=1495645 RepID=A0A917GMV2_9FLAO|nr:site-specific integrase [Bizionia arctica]GGG52120.1 transposase [Bizionia arctica]